MKIFIGKNISCDLNYQYYKIYNDLSEKFEITEDVSQADKIVFAASCSCTQINILKTIQYIDSVLKQKKDTAQVYLSGCITREFTNEKLVTVSDWLKKNVDYIVSEDQPNLLLKLIDEQEFKNTDANDFGYTIDTDDSTSANIWISKGCLNNCSFCKTTFQKLPLKSVDLQEVKDSIDYWDEYNISNLRLMGTNICQYGIDINHKYLLPELIEYTEQKRNIKTLELIGFSFKDAIQNHFQDVLKISSKTSIINGSLESGSPRILELIRKGFTREEIIDFINNINQITNKNLILNIISGFPTETQEDVMLTLDTLKQLNPYKVFICRYTNSPFVDSNFFEQLSPIEIQEHTRIYSKVLQQRNMKHKIIGDGYKYNS